MATNPSTAYDHEAALERARNEHLDELGAPRDARGRAAWFDQRAEQARVDAARQVLATLAADKRDDEQARIAADVAADRRERERLADTQATLDGTLAAANAAVDRERAQQVARELAEANAQLDARIARRLPNIQARVDMKLPLTVGEQRLLERYGGVH